MKQTLNVNRLYILLPIRNNVRNTFIESPQSDYVNSLVHFMKLSSIRLTKQMVQWRRWICLKMRKKHPIKCMPLGTNELMFHCAPPPTILQRNDIKNLLIKFNQLQLICDPMLTFILEPRDIFYLFSLLSPSSTKLLYPCLISIQCINWNV